MYKYKYFLSFVSVDTLIAVWLTRYIFLIGRKPRQKEETESNLECVSLGCAVNFWFALFHPTLLSFSFGKTIFHFTKIHSGLILKIF